MMGEVPSGIRSGLRKLLIAVASRDGKGLVAAIQDVGVLLPSADTGELERALTQLFSRFGGMGFAQLREVDPREFRDFAITWVFAETLPDYFRISDCCSSWMITPAGYLWENAFWGNHNSRDNFTDYVMGYLAAFEAEKTPGLPADLAEAARRAADAGRRTGDAIVGAGMIQMTVGERGDYDTLIPGGHVRPDGSQQWQDLGSLASCTMVYTAQAISSEGLRHPVLELPVPGDVFSQGLQHIFDLFGLPLSAPVPNCTSIDDAFMGLRWQDILNLKLHGTPWYEVAEKISHVFPSLLIKLLGSTADDFQEMMLGAVALCCYAQIVSDEALYAEARQTLENLIQMTYHLTDLVYGIEMNPKLSAQAVRELGKKPAARNFSKAEKLYYMAALYGRMFDIDTPVEYLRNFDLGNNRIENIERHLNYPDTMPKRLKTDKELYDLLFRPETGALVNHKQPWIAERYEEHFGKMVPVRRTDDGYECIGPDGQWTPTENDRHRRFGNIELWYEAPLCSTETLHTLDCSWARLGCAPADLNDGGAVDAEDLDLFNNAWIDYGEGAGCSRGNDCCSGADLDQNGLLDADDRGYMVAAQGCKR